MLVKFICKYCNCSWIEIVNETILERRACIKCEDKNLRALRLDEAKIDYYQGSPPFPNDNDEVENEPLEEQDEEDDEEQETSIDDLYSEFSGD